MHNFTKLLGQKVSRIIVVLVITTIMGVSLIGALRVLSFWQASVVGEIRDDIATVQQQISDLQKITDWGTYTEGTGMFTLKYPPGVVIGDHYSNPNKLTLTIEERPFEEFKDFPLGYDKDTAEKDIQALKEGNFGQHIDFALEESKEVLKIGGLNAKSFMVLGKFEVCDVTLERKAVFYIGKGDYVGNYHQIVITLSGPEKTMMESMEDYFKTDEVNCGDLKVWDYDKREEFYKTLVAGKGSEAAQNWYNTFDEIIKTIGVR